MVSIKIYVEGGGDRNKSLQESCREGFHKFFMKAKLEDGMPKVIPCGSRQNAYHDFCTALKIAGENDLPLLLVDSEDSVSQTAWEHLKSNDGWNRPKAAQDKQAHLMVQVM